MADYSYRAAVRELVPQLSYLDDVRVEEDRLSCSSTMGEDWAILRNSIRDGNTSQAATEDEETVESAYSRPVSARRPASSLSCVWPLSSSGSRPHTGSRSGSRPSSADSDLTTVEAETSILTHGAGKILFCGNPVQAIRARREKLRTAPTRSTFTPCDLPIHVPEHTFDLEEPDVRERGDVFAELRAWRQQHSRRLQAIETERLPQVLAIQHSDEGQGEDDDDEEGFGGLSNGSSDDEHGEEKHGDSLDTASPDSSFQSLSPDLHPRQALSPDMARLSLSPDTPLSPSAPLSVTAATGNRKLPGIRARRLRLSKTSSEGVPDFSSSDLTLQRFQRLAKTDVPLLPLPAHIPHPPPTSALGEGHMDSCTEMDLPSVQSGNKHLQTPHMFKPLDRPAITRPHTARAALQKHHQHHRLQSCRGSSQPD